MLEQHEKNDLKYISSQSDRFVSLKEWIDSNLSRVEKIILELNSWEQIYFLNSYRQLDKSPPQLEQIIPKINSDVLERKYPMHLKGEVLDPATEVASMLIPTYLDLLHEEKIETRLRTDMINAVVIAIDWLRENQHKFNGELGEIIEGGWSLGIATKDSEALTYASYQAAWGLMNFYENGELLNIQYSYEDVLKSLLDCYRFFLRNSKPRIKDSDQKSLHKLQKIGWPKKAGSKTIHALSTAYALEYLYYFNLFCIHNKERIENDLQSINVKEKTDFQTVEKIIVKEEFDTIWKRSLELDFEELVDSTINSYNVKSYLKTRDPHKGYGDDSGNACAIWICLATEDMYPDIYSNKKLENRLSENIGEVIKITEPHISEIQYVIDAISDFSLKPSQGVTMETIFKKQLEHESLLKEILKLLKK